MSDDWLPVTLGDLIEVKHGFAFDGQYFREQPTGSVLLTPGNFHVGGGFKRDKLKYYDGPVPGEYLLKPGDLIVTMTDLSKSGDTLGYPALVPDSVSVRYLHNQRIGKVLLKPSAPVTKPFLYCLMRWKPYRDEVLASATGTTVKHTSPTRIAAFEFLLPSSAEQDAIASMFGALDAKIELNCRMNETLEAIARAIFKSWFVDFDPVRAKAAGRHPAGISANIAALFPKNFIDSTLGKIPAGWRATTLGAEADRCRGTIQTGPFGSQLHASDYVAEGVPVVMPQDIESRRVSTVRISRVREKDAVRLARHRLRVGDVVYSRRGDVERHALISSREVGWLCGTGCLLARLGPKWPSPAFTSMALDRPETRAWISQHAIGATMPNLNTGILAAVPLIVPPDDILSAFSRIVQPQDCLAVQHDAECETLSTLRDTLLPKLLSGELKVNQAEKAVGAAL